MDDLEKRFKEASTELQQLIGKRKNSWKLTSVMDFDDVASEILAHIWKVFNQYDPLQPLDRWANTVITSQLKNLLRNHLWKNSRPCVAASSYGSPCVFNTGNNGCRWTKENPKGSGSGIQDSSCWAYARWEKKKRDKQAIASPISLDDTGSESDPVLPLHDKLASSPSSFIDYEGAKLVIDQKIIPRLDKEQAKIYHLLYVRKLDMKEVGKRMGYKRQKNSKIPGYLILREAKLHFAQLAKKIIEEENLCE